MTRGIESSHRFTSSAEFCDRVEHARRRIPPEFTNTPLDDVTLSAPGGAQRLLLKLETRHALRSFKGRGAFAFVVGSLEPREVVVTASAGNFGHALAYAAGTRDHRLIVFAAVGANTRKLQSIRDCGATVIQSGDDFDAAKEAGKAWALERGLRFVEDGAEPTIMEGAATIAPELQEQAPTIDTLYIPLGNGALAAGIGQWYKAQRSNVRVVAVVAAGVPCMMHSLEAGHVVATSRVDTIADGVAVRTPVVYALSVLTGVIDEVISVSDDQLLRTMRSLYAEAQLAVEPSAALGVCAALTQPAAGVRAAIVTGANLTAQQLAEWYG
ncbi:MAG TPA: pyridoxal-phosphate dependent enzyme [Gemmatimonas sp.]|nr:pyridoxal-phosphate dependent enzyme [Gemmatimonas sp.]